VDGRLDVRSGGHVGSDDSVRRVPPARRSRVLARLYTGRAGHLYGGMADSTSLLSRYLLARARGRAREALGRFSGRQP
jgi:hypothetical protein